MNTLITGAAGFIGSHLANRLLKENNSVICLDNFSDYYNPNLKEDNIKDILDNENFQLVRGDILNQNLLLKTIKDNSVEYVFHLAAQPGVRFSVQYPEITNKINVEGTLNVLNAALKSDIKKLIFASSSSIFGKNKRLPIDENHPTEPISPYGVSKLAAEKYCNVFRDISGLNITILRYFTVYGPRMRPDLGISIFFKKALSNDKIEIFGTGDQTRDFTYIDDAIDATLLACKKGKDVYNIGGGKRTDINSLISQIKKITNSKSEIIHSNFRKGEMKNTLADITKAKNELKWSPKTKIEDGLKLYFKWLTG